MSRTRTGIIALCLAIAGERGGDRQDDERSPRASH